MEGTNSVIHVEDLTMAYRETPVLWDIDLDVPEHVRCAIVGPNGAGKSTLLKGILGLVKPVSGAVQLWGKPLSAVQKEIAYVPQRGSVHWDFSTSCSWAAMPIWDSYAAPARKIAHTRWRPWKR